MLREFGEKTPVTVDCRITETRPLFETSAKHSDIAATAQRGLLQKPKV
jgi:hypothetical protein